MRQTFVTIFISLLFVVQVFPQNAPQNELSDLREKLSPLVSADNFRDAVPIAEKIVKLEKNGGNANFANYAAALLDLAVYQHRLLVNYPERRVTTAPKDRSKEIDEARKNLRDAVAIYEKRLNDPLKLSIAQGEFGIFIYRYGDPDSMEKTKRDEKIENLLLSALKGSDLQIGSNSDASIRIIGYLCARYFRNADFEKFLPLSTRYLSTVEKRSSARDPWLDNSLRMYATFLTIVGLENEKEYKETLKKIDGSVPLDQPIYVNYPDFMSRATSPIVHRIRVGLPQVRNDDALPRANSQVFVGSRVNPQVAIVIDEKGNVIEAKPGLIDAEMAAKVVKEVLTWKFKPIVYEGAARKQYATINVSLY